MGTVIASNNFMTKFYLLLFGMSVLLATGCYSKQEESDALMAAEQVHTKLQAGDFLAVYQEAGPGFQKAMDKSNFVDGLARVYKENGRLKQITPRAYQSGRDAKDGRIYTVISDLEFENVNVRERLVFTRSESGQLQLWDLVMDRLP